MTDSQPPTPTSCQHAAPGARRWIRGETDTARRILSWQSTPRRFVFAFVLWLWPGQSSATEQDFNPLQCDPTRVLGANSCAKCHENELRQWMQTPHHESFESLHRKPEAKAITKRLGLSTVKRNDTCVQCHYTQQQKGERLRVVAGVSCESCHGAARDWLALHNDYGGPNATRATESEQHRQQRRDASVAAGMNNPMNVYLIARQCLACHTTPDEQLVNIGGHKPGTPEFELVSYSQGIVRHNFLRTGGASNGAATQAQLRVMYVVGVMADLEASLRATAQATVKAPFGVASAQRAAGLKRRLNVIRETIDDPYVQQALDAALHAPLKLNQSETLLAAAEKIGSAAFEFAANADGSKLAALDPLLPKPEQYKQ